MTVDYEVEFDNRARVPEHPAIFARWESATKDYRDHMSKAGRAELNVRYGGSDRQIIDIFHPDGDRAQAPLVVFIHGGFWRALHPSAFSHMANGLNAHGVTMAFAGYDLCPEVTLADIITQMKHACLFLWRHFNRRMVVAGHSAGGHLTACMVATDWPAAEPHAPADLVMSGYAISGVYDLMPLLQTSVNDDVHLDETWAKRLSPVNWKKVREGSVLDAVVGGDESSEFLRQSKLIADTWRERGATTRYEAVPRANHFTVIDPLTDPDSAMVARIATLAAATRG